MISGLTRFSFILILIAYVSHSNGQALIGPYAGIVNGSTGLKKSSLGYTGGFESKFKVYKPLFLTLNLNYTHLEWKDQISTPWFVSFIPVDTKTSVIDNASVSACIEWWFHVKGNTYLILGAESGMYLCSYNILEQNLQARSQLAGYPDLDNVWLTSDNTKTAQSTGMVWGGKIGIVERVSLKSALSITLSAQNYYQVGFGDVRCLPTVSLGLLFLTRK